MGINETIPINEKDLGFRIYKLSNNSPLKLAGVKEISDFIIPPQEIYQKKIPFYTWIKEKEGQNINLKIYSLLTRSIKEININLNKKENNEGLLGGSFNYENYKEAYCKLLHVTKVKKNSFAMVSLNLIDMQDYLIAVKNINESKYFTINNSLKKPIESFISILKENKGKQCEFFIYNIKRGPKIVLATIPNDKNFSFGCDVAYGKVHEFPMKKEDSDDEEKKILKG